MEKIVAYFFVKKITCDSVKKLNNLRGKAIVNLFCAPSTAYTLTLRKLC